jgi:hypothetical protein
MKLLKIDGHIYRVVKNPRSGGDTNYVFRLGNVRFIVTDDQRRERLFVKAAKIAKRMITPAFMENHIDWNYE